MKRSTVAALTVFVWIAAPPAKGQNLPDHPLTLGEALQLLRTNNPALAAARAHLQAIQAGEVTAGLRPNPIFTSANEDFNVFNPSKFDPANAQEFTDNILLTIERGNKRHLRVQSAKLATTLAQEGYRDIVRQLEFAVKSAFTAMLFAKAGVQLADQNLRDYAETVRLNEIRLKAGDISQTEFDRIKSEQAKFESDALNTRLALGQARIQLEQLLGLSDYPESFDIQGELTAPEINLSLNELVARALEHRPDYQAARDGIRKAGADAQLAVANGATDVSVGGEYKRNGPDNTLGFTMQIPLRVFDRNQGEKLRTRYELTASQVTELAVRNAVRADVTQAYELYRAAIARARLYSRDYLERARRIRDRIQFSYRNGGSSLLDYLDALRTYRDTELAWRSAHADAMAAGYQLSFTTGTDVTP